MNKPHLLLFEFITNQNVLKLEYIFPIISTSLWGISVTGAKIISDHGFSPIEIVFGRFLIGSIIFLPILVFQKVKHKNIMPKEKKTWGYLFALSLSGVALNNSIFYLGLSLTDASIAALLAGLSPLTTILFAMIILREPPTRRKAISLIIGFIGVVLIIGYSYSPGKLTGNLLILLAITIWGSSFSFSKLATNSGLSSINVTAWSEILGTTLLLPYILWNHSFVAYTDMNSIDIFWFLFIGILSSVLAYILHYRAVEVFGASRIATSTNIIPLSGAISAYFLLGETLSSSIIIGSIFVIFGVVIIQTEATEMRKTKI